MDNTVKEPLIHLSKREDMSCLLYTSDAADEL